MSNGKGDAPRPYSQGYGTYAANWDNIRWGPHPLPQLGHAAHHPTITQTKIVKARTVKKGKRK